MESYWCDNLPSFPHVPSQPILLYPMFWTCFSQCCNYTKATPFISALIISETAMLNIWHSFGSLELLDTWQGESDWAPPVCLNMLQANSGIFLFLKLSTFSVVLTCVHTVPVLLYKNKQKIEPAEVSLNTNICLTVCTVIYLGTQREVTTSLFLLAVSSPCCLCGIYRSWNSELLLWQITVAMSSYNISLFSEEGTLSVEEL